MIKLPIALLFARGGTGSTAPLAAKQHYEQFYSRLRITKGMDINDGLSVIV